MKKIGLLLIVLFIVTYVITGCGSGGGGGDNVQTGSVSGTVVDFNHPTQGIENIVVKIGTKTTTTDINGGFNLAAVPVGTYWVIASGSDSGSNHLAGSVNLTVTTGSNSCSPIQVYNIDGYGVTGINETTVSALSMTNQNLKTRTVFGNDSLKNSIHHDPILIQPKINAFNNGNNYLSASTSLLDYNLAYIYLHWKPLTGVSNPIYKIYLGTSEDATKMVWDSSNVTKYITNQYPAGSAYNASDPEAYLDIDEELKDQAITAGVYQFLVVEYDSGTKYKELPVISLSIGMNSAPTNLRRTNNQLSWSQVINADQYKVGIYSDVAMTNRLEESVLTQSATSYIFNSSTITGYPSYYWIIEAYVNDGAGWPMEINAGISTFSLP